MQYYKFCSKEAFRYEDVDVYYKTVNIYKFSRDFSINEYVPFLEAYSRVMGNNEYYEQVLRVLTLLHTSSLKALPIGDKKWYEIDDVQDLDIASIIFAESDNRLSLYQKRYGGLLAFSSSFGFLLFGESIFPFSKDER